MRRMPFSLVIVILTIVRPLTGAAEPRTMLGIDVLLAERIELVEGKRVGLITNPSGVDGNLVLTADRLVADPRVELVQLYGPEHGIRGDAFAGDNVEDGTDPVTGIPVESLYGVRSRPTAESLGRIDVLLFDIQDIGSRTYTYVSTMGDAMKAAAAAGKPFIVLDRPNPIGGILYEGAIIEPQFRSGIGWGPTPVTHGMTAGELARFFNGELAIGCDLTVVPMKGWKRTMMWDDTGLHWVQTSTHIPHPLQAYLYVATGMLGGPCDNVNEGVGYTLPFETIAAEFIDPGPFAAALNEAGLPGVAFRPIVYKPYYFRFQDKRLAGVHLLLTDRGSFRPLHTALALLTTLQRLYPDDLKFRGEENFARHWGNKRILEAIRGGRSAEEIEASWADELEDFGRKRANYLIYR